MNEVYSVTHFLNAGEGNAQRVIPIPMLIQRLIDAATEHASQLGVGYADLRRHGLSWVLSRLTLEMDTYPTIDSEYTISTWVDSINRHFTERCFSITAADGRVLGHARTVWIAIDMDTRTGADMTAIMAHALIVKRDCPVKRGNKIPAVTDPDMVREHRFKYCDIDFNRHVNSTRYIETILNDRDVDFYDTHTVSRFEIAYLDEIHYADPVLISRRTDGNVTTAEITRNGVPVTRARITFR